MTYRYRLPFKVRLINPLGGKEIEDRHYDFYNRNHNAIKKLTRRIIFLNEIMNIKT